MDPLLGLPGFLLVAIGLTFLLAGTVKGVIGLGLPTVAIGLLGLVMPPMAAAALLVVPSLVTNIWQSTAGRNLMPLLRRLWPLLTGIGAGTWGGAALLPPTGSHGASAALGAALVVYALTGLGSVRFSVPRNAEPWLAPAIGVMTGIVTAATGIFVIPAVPYLQALNLDKDDLVQAMGMMFTVSTLALAVSLAHGGAFGADVAAGSLLALLGALAGMVLGQRIRTRVSPVVFRTCFFAGLLALGSHLLLRAF